MSVLGSYASNEQAGLLGIVNRVREQAGNLLRRVEGGTMRGDGIVPTPLTLAQQGLDRSHFSLGSTLIDDELSLEVGTSQLLFGTVANLVTLLLTVVNVLAQNLGILTVTSLAGAINLSQRRLNLDR